MVADASVYAVLGLKTGADRAAVEHAYKTLIKAHHPDRAGGDGVRAAEINRAYRELRRACSNDEQDSDPLGGPESTFDLPSRSWRWVAPALGVAVVAGLVALLAGLTDGWVADFRIRAAPLATQAGRSVPPVTEIDAMEQPLNDAAIRAGTADALQVARTRNETIMAEASRKCQAALRLQPSLVRLDRCAAFDDSIVQLQNRDPWRDDGPFSGVAVTGRAISAAGLLSDDYLAIDGRLDRIRLAVEVALVPPVPPPEPPPSNFTD